MATVPELLRRGAMAPAHVSAVDAVMGEDWAHLELGRGSSVRPPADEGRRTGSRRRAAIGGVLSPNPQALVKLIGTGGTATQPRAQGADGLSEPAGRRAAALVREHLRRRARPGGCRAARGRLGAAGHRSRRRRPDVALRGQLPAGDGPGGGGEGRAGLGGGALRQRRLRRPLGLLHRLPQGHRLSAHPRRRRAQGARRGPLAAGVVAGRAHLRPAARGAGRGGGPGGDRADRHNAAVARGA